MHLYIQVPQDIQTAFQGVKDCLEKVDDFSNDFLLDAELEVSDIDESTCHHLCLDIKLACVSLQKIQLSLSEIAKNYNNSFVTDYPLFFQMYRDQYQILMTEDARQLIHKMEEMAGMAGDGEKAGDAEMTGDEEMAGDAKMPPALKRLCQEVGALEELTRHILALCQKTMDREERLKQNPKRCVKMLLQVIEEATRNQQGVIQMYQQMGSSLMPKTQPDGKPTMSEVMKRYGSLEEFASAQLHQFSMSDVNAYVVEKALMESRLQGLTEEEMEWWGEEPEMARKVRYVIEHLDELGVESKTSAKASKAGSKHLIDAKCLYMLTKWAHLADATTQVSVPRFFQYFRSVYQGRLELPSISNYHKYKSQISPQEYQQFQQKIEQLLQNRKLKAMQVTLQAEI